MPSSRRSKRGTKKAATEPPAQVEAGGGNVFAELGIAQPDLALVKARLVQQIRDLIAEQGLNQMQAAKLLGLDQPKVSALVRGRTSGYTTDRLFKFLNLLGRHVDITIRPVTNNATAAETRVVLG
ncbi:helix-turn-helix domain-containing protein [Frigoriglobus tundricola]|uniref:Transcriptional regulator, XRE family n=1 Tax=Frigoriglobus tundricola TaxID=2774151 RepID=A0A6M5YP90_9BACT|nr:helix-turn-helix transcriptional regulator [Frigoriglobus tundricola]QJW95788.1 transcriptional regulator, XRE family [Frigoriglobus tundricola]